MFHGRKVIAIFSLLVLLASFVFLIVTWYVFRISNQGQSTPDAGKNILQDSSEKVSVLIVPHHLLAQKEIIDAFQRVSDILGKNSIHRIILLSPNHFNTGFDWVIGSDRSWETSSGTLIADEKNLSDLRDIAFVDRNILEREHGIRNLLPFAKEYFPQASILPLALRDGFPDQKADVLSERLLQLSDSGTLLIVSVDFSHYLDANFSRSHDTQSLEALTHLESTRANSLDVDCASCLRVAMKYAEARRGGYFHFLSRSSSLEMVHSDAVGQETSHITGYYSSLPNQSEGSVKKNDDGGDIVSLLFSDSVLPVQMTPSARRVFMGQDLNIIERDGDEKFALFDIRKDNFLSESVSSNTNSGQSGIQVETRIIKNKRIAFVSNTLSKGKVEEDHFLEGIARTKAENDIVIALLETFGPREERLKERRRLIDFGADAVLTWGARGIEPLEIYNSKPIFSSLGDASHHGIIIGMSIDFSTNTFEYNFLPVLTDIKGRTALATDTLRQEILQKFSMDTSNKTIQQDILQGRLVICNESVE